MLVGVVIWVDEYLASSVSGSHSIPYILNTTDTSEKKYVDVFQFLDREGIKIYLSMISTKLNVSFRRSVTQYTVADKLINLVIFYSPGRDDKEGCEPLSIASINSVFSDKPGSVITAVSVNSPEISQSQALKSFVNHIRLAISEKATNGLATDKVDKKFFYPTVTFSHCDFEKHHHKSALDYWEAKINDRVAKKCVAHDSEGVNNTLQLIKDAKKDDVQDDPHQKDDQPTNIPNENDSINKDPKSGKTKTKVRRRKPVNKGQKTGVANLK